MATLVYPRDGETEPARAEALSPWRGGDETFVFRRPPTDAAACRDEIARLIGQPAS